MRSSFAHAALFAFALFAATLAPAARAAEPASCLTRVCPDYLITPDKARAWHAEKDKLGPALSGDPSWRHYLEFVEAQFRRLGAADIARNAWTYDRWHTSQWPDDSKWSLASDGKPVKVASYVAYSGSTGPEGVTAPLVYYDAIHPPADETLAGKIIVFQTRATPEAIAAVEDLDYESPATDDSYPTPGRPVPPNIRSVSAPIWAQLLHSVRFIALLAKSKAAGGVFVFDSTFDQMAGLYTFPVPRLFPAPSLYLDREAGARVIADAKSGATATLKLVAEITPSETWQLVAYLPGRDYGTPRDEQILFTTHSDGPSISQDNGPLGLLAVAKYFSHVPQADRPRTLLFFLDNRHYMPGREEAFAPPNWFAKNPRAADQVVAVIGLEHLGQIEFVEDAGHLRPSGRVDRSNLWSTNNQKLIDLAVKAVADNQLRGVVIRAPARPGQNGRAQGPWYGLGRLANELKKPGLSTMGSMGVYWSTSSRLDRFDAPLFCRQIATFCQLTGALMQADMAELQTVSTK